MKRFGFISFVLMLMAVVTCNAQNNKFEKKFQELFLSEALGNSVNPDQMESSFSQIATGIVGADKAMEKTTKYMKEQFIADYTSILSPYYEEILSIKDIDFLIKRCNTPEGKLAAEHCASLNSAETQAKMQSSMTPIMMNALQGLPYEKIKAVDCSESYKQKCLEYVKATGSCDDIIESMFTALNGIADQVAEKGDEEEVQGFKTMMNNLKTFMVENLPVIYLNMSHGKISEADFDFYIDLYSTQAGKNLIKGNKAMMKDIMNVSMQLVQKYAEWLEKNK